MTATISSWGNSQGLRFPKDIMKELHLSVGDKMKVFGYIYLKKTDQRQFVEFTSEKELLKYMKRLSSFHIVIPEIELIYVYGFDDTNHLYYKDKKN